MGVLHIPSCVSGSSLWCTGFASKCTSCVIMYIRSLTWVYCICQEYYICHHGHIRSHLGVLYLAASVLHMKSCALGASLWCTAFGSKCTAYEIMCFRSLTLVHGVCQQVEWICHHVDQEPHLGVLHLAASVLHMKSCTSGVSLRFTAFGSNEYVLHMKSCTSGASLGCTAFANRCTAEAIMDIKSHLGVLHLPTGVMDMPSCTSGASLGCTANAIMYIRSLTWVYCIWQQVYAVLNHVLQEPHLGVLHLPTGVLQRPSCVLGFSLWCTAFASKCTACVIMYIRSLTWVYCICEEVYCRGKHGHQESLRCTAFDSKCIAYEIMYFRSLTWVYCICQNVYCRGHLVFQDPHFGVFAFGNKCTAYETMCFRSLTLVHCIWQQVYWSGYTIMYIKNLSCVSCICQQVYCI